MDLIRGIMLFVILVATGFFLAITIPRVINAHTEVDERLTSVEVVQQSHANSISYNLERIEGQDERIAILKDAVAENIQIIDAQQREIDRLRGRQVTLWQTALPWLLKD